MKLINAYPILHLFFWLKIEKKERKVLESLLEDRKNHINLRKRC